MSVTPHDLWVGLPSLARPPIDRLPSAAVEEDMLAEFVRRRTRSWGRVRVPLSPPVIGALWTEFALIVVLAGYLLAVRAGAAPCSGLVCTAVTLGDHPLLTLVLAEVSAAAFVVSAPMTRGLSRAGGPQLALIVIGVATGLIALAGSLAVLLGAALCLLVGFGLFVFVVDRL